MELGPQLAHIELSPFFGWLFRSKVRSFALHENGLVVQTGVGATVIAWSRVESLIAAAAIVADKRSGAVRSTAGSFFELRVEGMRPIKLSSSAARVASERVTDLIVERAGLEWFAGEAYGRPLPPMALKPAVAANLRASFQAAQRAK